MSRATLVLGCLLLLAEAAQAFTVRDMLSREVVLAAPPARIVSLVPSATEIIFALGGEGRLVGVTNFCDFPPAAKQKPSVGGMVAPNLEGIVALKPDLVIATDAGNRQETVVQLQRLGIPAYLVSVNRFADLTDLIARLGELTGQQAAAVSLTESIERRIQAVRNRVTPFRQPRVLYVLWPEPLIVPGRDALITELIQFAGGMSVTAGNPQAYPRYSLEAAVAGAPEVIILANHGSGSSPMTREKWERLRSLPAIKAGRVHSMDGNLVHRYGPRVVDGLEQLARLIHPEVFR